MATNATGQGKSRISLVVDDELKARIGRKATENGISMNAYIEVAIAEALRNGMRTETVAVYETPGTYSATPDPEADAANARELDAIKQMRAKRKGGEGESKQTA